MISRDVLVVGASAAGVAAAEALRRFGHGDRIVLGGDEPHLPYDRPPLSKQLLSGQWDPDKLRLRTTAAYDELDNDLRIGTRARSLDVTGHRGALEGGTSPDYDHVVLADGPILRADAVRVVDGDLASHRFTALFGRGG